MVMGFGNLFLNWFEASSSPLLCSPSDDMMTLNPVTLHLDHLIGLLVECLP